MFDGQNDENDHPNKRHLTEEIFEESPKKPVGKLEDRVSFPVNLVPSHDSDNHVRVTRFIFSAYRLQCVNIPLRFTRSSKCFAGCRLPVATG
jgi:hypothetical protein